MQVYSYPVYMCACVRERDHQLLEKYDSGQRDRPHRVRGVFTFSRE